MLRYKKLGPKTVLWPFRNRYVSSDCSDGWDSIIGPMVPKYSWWHSGSITCRVVIQHGTGGSLPLVYSVLNGDSIETVTCQDNSGYSGNVEDSHWLL